MNLKDLEAAFTKLEQRVAALEAKQPATKPASVEVPVAIAREQGVRIVSAPARPLIAMPDEGQLRELVAQVYLKFPRLRPNFCGRWAAEDEEEGFRNIAAGFEWLSTVRRTSKLNTKVYLSVHADFCAQWWRERGRSRTTTGGAVLIAAIAAGDIWFSLNYHYLAASELAIGFDGVVATEAWRNVLRGQILEPISVSQATKNPVCIDYR